MCMVATSFKVLLYCPPILKMSLPYLLTSDQNRGFILQNGPEMYSQTCLIRPWLIRLNDKPAKNGMEQIFPHRNQC